MARHHQMKKCKLSSNNALYGPLLVYMLMWAQKISCKGTRYTAIGYLQREGFWLGSQGQNTPLNY